MSFELIEIFIFAGIAAFLVFKLYSVLGQKTGFEASKTSSSFEPSQEAQETQEQTVEESSLSPALKKLIVSLQERDPTFTLEKFIGGATRAFEMILEAFSRGDKSTLQRLCGDKVYQEFEETIEERNARGETHETTLVKIESVRLTGGRIQQDFARLTVEFQTEQVPLLRDRAGKIIEGNLKQIDQVRDVWTFQRDLSRTNPNWLLIKTSS